MSNENKTIIEINGVKMEVDLRQAKMVHENIRVGTKVKVLEKSDYQTPTVRPGVVVGFEAFKEIPTIIVAYVKDGWGETNFVNFAYINSSEGSRKKWEIVPTMDDEISLSQENVLGGIDREIKKHERNIEDLKARREYFVRNFGVYFSDGELV